MPVGINLHFGRLPLSELRNSVHIMNPTTLVDRQVDDGFMLVMSYHSVLETAWRLLLVPNMVNNVGFSRGILPSVKNLEDQLSPNTQTWMVS